VEPLRSTNAINCAFGAWLVVRFHLTSGCPDRTDRWSGWCLVTAIAALGIKASFWKLVILMLAGTLLLLLLEVVCIHFGLAGL
jgi:membrane-bound ClpP family serine protease